MKFRKMMLDERFEMFEILIIDGVIIYNLNHKKEKTTDSLQ